MKKLRCQDCKCVLSDLDEGTLTKISRTINQINYRKGMILFEQGMPVFGCYSICAGGG